MTSREFTALATIDAAYYMLKVEQKNLEKVSNDKQFYIDLKNSSGQDQKVLIMKNIEVILKDMIKAKRILNIDVDDNIKFLKQIKKMINENTNKNQSRKRQNNT